MSPPTHQVLSLHRHNERVYRVIHQDLGYIGNVQLTGTGWKFKAIGYDDDGSLIPGGGPFTQHHNLLLDEPESNLLAQTLLPSQAPPVPPP